MKKPELAAYVHDVKADLLRNVTLEEQCINYAVRSFHVSSSLRAGPDWMTVRLRKHEDYYCLAIAMTVDTAVRRIIRCLKEFMELVWLTKINTEISRSQARRLYGAAVLH